MPDTKIPVVLFGLGAIGRLVARAAVEQDGIRVAAAVDADPAIAGRPLEALWKKRSPGGPVVAASLAEATGIPRRGGVLIHAAGSRLRDAAPRFEEAMSRGLAVVSSCEELLWPWDDQPRLALRLHRAARRAGVAVLAAGVNPGFVMDLLPVVATAVCRDIRRVHVVRAVDASRRRQPLQRKVGVGLSVREFRARARRGEIGHVGLPESARFLAAALGWNLTRVSNRLRPVVAAPDGGSPLDPDAPVEGQHQVVVGRVDGREVIRLDLTMARGTDPDHDEIRIEGTPPLRLRLEPGAAGDEATVSALLAGALRVRQEEAGLAWGPRWRLPRGRGR